MNTINQFNQELVENILADQVHNNLHTIQDFLRWTYSIFNHSDIYYGHGYDNAWDESLQLVLNGLQLPIDFPEQFYNSKLTQSEKELLIQLVIARIEQRLPIAYLTNSAWFCGLEFYVDERVIVPRSPISALIMDKFQDLIQQEPARILDLCTGSGCIAIACAEQFPQAEVDAVDLSFDALNVAEINIERHNLTHRVFPIQSDLFNNLPGDQYDLIVTNPPYVDKEDLEDMPEEFHHEPEMALGSGIDGLTHRVFPIQSDLFNNLPGDQYDLIVTNPPYVDKEDLEDMPEEFHHEPEMALGSGIDGLTITKEILANSADYLTDNGILICEVGNSMVHLIEQFPDVPFQWLELKNGGLGVFALHKTDLLKYRKYFC